MSKTKTEIAVQEARDQLSLAVARESNAADALKTSLRDHEATLANPNRLTRGVCLRRRLLDEDPSKSTLRAEALLLKDAWKHDPQEIDIYAYHAFYHERDADIALAKSVLDNI